MYHVECARSKLGWEFFEQVKLLERDIVGSRPENHGHFQLTIQDVQGLPWRKGTNIRGENHSIRVNRRGLSSPEPGLVRQSFTSSARLHTISLCQLYQAYLVFSLSL